MEGGRETRRKRERGKEREKHTGVFSIDVVVEADEWRSRILGGSATVTSVTVNSTGEILNALTARYRKLSAERYFLPVRRITITCGVWRMGPLLKTAALCVCCMSRLRGTRYRSLRVSSGFPPAKYHGPPRFQRLPLPRSLAFAGSMT